MNLLDVTITKVITEPYQIEDGKWVTVVITNCWGQEEETIIKKIEQSEIEKYVVGYRWQE